MPTTRRIANRLPANDVSNATVPCKVMPALHLLGACPPWE